MLNCIIKLNNSLILQHLKSDKEYNIEVYDILGNKVMELSGNTIDLSHLSRATYIVKAFDKIDQEYLSYKVIKH
jgi:hypothetical protein